MRRGIADLWYLNVVWGAIFIVLFWLRTASTLVLLSTLILSLFVTAIIYFGETMILKARLAQKQPTLTYQLNQYPEIERAINIGIFILNLIAYFVLWFVLPNFTRVEEDVYVRMVIWWLFLLVIYVDFGRTGRIMARERFTLERSDQLVNSGEIES